MAAMNKRLLVIVGVFAGGFGLGYALTWLLVSNPSPADPAAGSPAVAAAAKADGIPTNGVSPAGGSRDEVSGTIPVDPDPGGDEEPRVEVAPSDGGDERVDDGGTEAGTPGGDPGAESDPPEADDPGGDDPGAEVDVPEEPPADAPWWVACKGKTCAIDFGRVSGSVSLREGKIEDGEEVVWRETFGKAERIGSVPAKDGLKVELHAVGLQHKLPVAAWITYQDGGKELTGVMALNIGDKVIKMAPVAP